MSEYFGQVDYAQLGGEDRQLLPSTGSKIVATANLLKRLGHEVDPATLDQFFAENNVYRTAADGSLNLYWDAVTEYEPSVQLVSMSTGWPSIEGAIVKFRCQSVQQPHVNVGGIPTPNIIEHFCVVADPLKKLIIDSYDGEVKRADPYGVPVTYAVYTTQLPQVRNIPEDANTRVYTVLRGGESAWDIAKKLKMPAVELIEHNDIQTPSKIPSGTEIHLPYRTVRPEARIVTYEVLKQPLRMHISQKEGATKFAFGDVKKWEHIKPTGPKYLEGTNVKVVAIAHVPIEEDGSEAAFYMDARALGPYNVTGMVSQTIGFNHSHLSDGFVDAPVRPKRPRPQPVPPPQAMNPNHWKTTQVPLNEQRWPVEYVFGETVMVYDLDNVRPPREVPEGKHVMIYSTVNKDGVLYARPVDAVEAGNWLAIPMEKLIPADKMYNTVIPRSEKLAMTKEEQKRYGNLTLLERYWFNPQARIRAQYARLSLAVTKKQKNKE